MNEIRLETSLNEIILEAIEKYMGDWDEAITEARTKILSNPEIAQGLEAIEKGFNAKVDREAELPATALDDNDYKELDELIIKEMTENWRIGGRRPSSEFAGKRLAVLSARKQEQKTRDMLKEGWVKEVDVSSKSKK